MKRNGDWVWNEEPWINDNSKIKQWNLFIEPLEALLTQTTNIILFIRKISIFIRETFVKKFSCSPTTTRIKHMKYFQHTYM